MSSRLRQSILIALLVTFTGTAAAQPAPPQVPIVVWSFGFQPKPLHLRAGQPVTLTFTNRSGSSHDFTAREFFASSRIVAGAAPGGEIELQGGQTRSVTLVPTAGTYHAHCSHFMHSAMGMTDTIIVD